MDAVGHGIYLRPYQPYELKRVLFKREHYRPLPSRTRRRPTTARRLRSRRQPADAGQAVSEPGHDRGVLGPLQQADEPGHQPVGRHRRLQHERQRQPDQPDAKSPRRPITRCAARSSRCGASTCPDFEMSSTRSMSSGIPTPFKHEHRAVRALLRALRQPLRQARLDRRQGACCFLTIVKSIGHHQGGDPGRTQGELWCARQRRGQRQDGRRAARSCSSSSQCSVAGKGGDELKLAALSTLDEAKYNAWLQHHPRQPPDHRDGGRRNLDARSTTRTRRRRCTMPIRRPPCFTAISAAFAIDKIVYFVRGRKVLLLSHRAAGERKAQAAHRQVAGAGARSASIASTPRSAAGIWSTRNGERSTASCSFLPQGQVARIDIDTGDARSRLSRKPISDGLPRRRASSASTRRWRSAATRVYFFYRKQVRPLQHEERTRWTRAIRTSSRSAGSGVTFERIDAAIYWGNGKVYFFKDDQHIRYDLGHPLRPIPATPSRSVGNYVEDWRFFD